jgi:peptidoglycan hydrolase FlgJ
MSISATGASNAANDISALATLRTQAANDPKAAIKAAAKQFEAMFMQQLLKSMRESSMGSGMLENSGSQMGTEMLDSQYATKMAGLPNGLADVIARQLERQVSGPAPAAALPAAGAAGAPQAASLSASQITPSQEDFLRTHQQAAQAASAQSGIPAPFMLAQAAHESGWGKHEIRNADGSSAHNLFGIKAGANWSGKVATITTTEVVDGQPRKVVANFRAYDSDAESFSDFAQLMKDNPRYAKVVAAGGSVQGYAQGLQSAGYATDPAYANKLTRVINTTLRMQRAALNTAPNPSLNSSSGTA